MDRTAEQIAADLEMETSLLNDSDPMSALLRETAEALRELDRECLSREKIGLMWERDAARSQEACREVVAILEPIASGPNRIAIYHIEDALAAARKGAGK